MAISKQQEQALARRLEGFDAVWRRVTAAKSAVGAAEKQGVTLMPRKKNCRRRNCRRP